MSEKSWNFKKKVSQVKKITNFWKVLQNCKKREIEKKQLKSKPNIKKLRRNLITILESFEKKAWKDQKTANLEKSVKFEKIMKKMKTMFLKKVNKTLKNFSWSVQKSTNLKSENA